MDRGWRFRQTEPTQWSRHS